MIVKHKKETQERPLNSYLDIGLENVSTYVIIIQA